MSFSRRLLVKLTNEFTSAFDRLDFEVLLRRKPRSIRFGD